MTEETYAEVLDEIFSDEYPACESCGTRKYRVYEEQFVAVAEIVAEDGNVYPKVELLMEAPEISRISCWNCGHVIWEPGI